MTHALRCRLVLAALLGASACGDSASPAAPSPAGPALLFDDVRLFDGEKVIARADVLVRGGTIAQVAERIDAPAGAEVVRGAGRTLLPGLIDSHVHIWSEAQLAQGPVFGVTTMLDMMTSPQLAASLRQKLASPAGSRWADLRSAGNPATAPGGHGTEYGIPI
ncbi:MAG TPA: hypothetical protein VNO33_10905, partial [Kofleriaceae bacterium]|nr:hypothetical protein [Kofleriaceae bacterium]